MAGRSVRSKRAGLATPARLGVLNDPLLPSHLDTRLLRLSRRRTLQPALLAAGIEPQLYCHGWHLLRHSAANDLGDVYATSRLLGHASVKITEAAYMHLGPKVSETEKLADYWQSVPEVCPANVPRNPKYIQ